ncbi:MAG: hypothetical protein DSY43_03880 [Gammaproteobacteria bacterium]|nr:MAG: hypothetical protein DSY43_03880 [Gammaproteobacteria bacterium]
MIFMLKKIAKKITPKLYARLAEIKSERKLESFKKKYPEVKIFQNEGEGNRKLHSQSNQDYIVYENFFKNNREGFFCDIGGNHPLKINNTLYFENLGWRGVAFEPLPYMGELWAKHRKAKLFPFALSDSEGEVEFTMVKDATGWEDMLSFVTDTRNADFDYEIEELIIQTKIFKVIMAKEEIVHIDYLSLDVEGHEMNILKGIDFNKVRINVLTIENNSIDGIYGDGDIREIMFENNFILWGRIMGLDDIYVHKDFIKNLKNN